MEHLYEYEDRDFYFHHTRTTHPDPENSAFHLQIHDKNELYYFLSGHGSFTVEGHPYPLRPGMVFVVRNGEAHSLRIQPDMPYERMTLLFSSRALDGSESAEALMEPYRLRTLGEGNCFQPGEFPTAFVRSCMDNMIVSTGTEEEKRLAVLSNLPPVLMALRRSFFERSHPEPMVSGIAGEIARFINRHLQDAWTLTDLEQHLHRNKDYLNRKFREAMGSSIWDYAIHKRISVAQEKLRNGRSISEVYESSGFRDYSTFYREYKNVTGKAPSEEIAEDKKQ